MNVTQIPVKTVRHAPKAILVNIAARAKSAFKERIVKLISMNALSSLVNLKQSVRILELMIQLHLVNFSAIASNLSVILVHYVTNVVLVKDGTSTARAKNVNSLKSITLQVIQRFALIRNALIILESAPISGIFSVKTVKPALLAKSQ
jgi:hypothetical protein